jgi:hypothetical protein
MRFDRIQVGDAMKMGRMFGVVFNFMVIGKV